MLRPSSAGAGIALPIPPSSSFPAFPGYNRVKLYVVDAGSTAQDGPPVKASASGGHVPHMQSLSPDDLCRRKTDASWV